MPGRLPAVVGMSESYQYEGYTCISYRVYPGRTSAVLKRQNFVDYPQEAARKKLPSVQKGL